MAYYVSLLGGSPQHHYTTPETFDVTWWSNDSDKRTVSTTGKVTFYNNVKPCRYNI